MKILEWTGKYNKKKFSNLENYYDNNAILFAPGSDVVQGKRNIKRVLQQNRDDFSIGNLGRRILTVTFSDSKKSAVVTGKFLQYVKDFTTKRVQGK